MKELVNENFDLKSSSKLEEIKTQKQIDQKIVLLFQKEILLENLLNVLDQNNIDVTNLLYTVFENIQSDNYIPKTGNSIIDDGYFLFQDKVKHPPKKKNLNSKLQKNLKINLQSIQQNSFLDQEDDNNDSFSQTNSEFYEQQLIQILNYKQMEEILKTSDQKINFQLETQNQKKCFCQIQLTNNSNKSKFGIKIKSTNVQRYVVNPTSAILNPLQTISIDFILSLQEKDDFSKIADKFCIYYLEITEPQVTNDNIEEFIKNNHDKHRKMFLRVLINLKNKETKTESNYESSIIQKSGFDQSSDFQSALNLKSQVNLNKEDFYSNMSQNQLVKLLIEKESNLHKVSEQKKNLQNELSIVNKTVRSKKVKHFENVVSNEIWKFLLIFFMGLVIGSFLNSA